MILLRLLHVAPFVAAMVAVRAVDSSFAQLQKKQQQALPACKALMPTDIWTTCQSFMDRYNVSLPDLVHMNPELQADCYGFKPGTSYCLLRSITPVEAKEHADKA